LQRAQERAGRRFAVRRHGPPEKASLHGSARVERTVRTRERRGRVLRPIGHVGDEASLIAKRAQQLACTFDVVIWVSDERIFAAPADAAAKVPPASLVGIYGAGVLLAEIERDLGRIAGG
jgi:hypothetical protein